MTAKAKPRAWRVTWADGTVTLIGTARGWKDALRRGVLQTQRPMGTARVIQSRTTESPLLYRQTEWRVLG